MTRCARKASSDIINRIKNGFRALPARHAPVLAARLGVDPHVLTVDLDDMIRQELTRIADEIGL